MTTHIITHRGLEPSNTNFYPESSYEAFEDQLKRGYGIEFDPNFTGDEILVWHDVTFERAKGKIPKLDEVLGLIKKSSSKINALHFKGKYQNKKNIQLLVKLLEKYSDILNRLFIFDVKPETARVLLKAFPDLQLAPSVAHQIDVKKYNSVVANTLFEMNHAAKMIEQGIFGKNPWMWLDEWGTKKLYTREVFEKMRITGAKIALVTPELHGTSPGLYGGESHPDAKDKDTLFKRIKEIVNLQPDAICTDYPEEIRLTMD